MINEHHDEHESKQIANLAEFPNHQNSLTTLPKCSTDLAGQREAHVDLTHEYIDERDVPEGFQNNLINPDAKEMRDIVETIENAVFRIINNKFDHLANHGSNTLGVRVKDSLILKVKQTDREEVPFDAFKSSLGWRLILDDDLQIRFLPQTESFTPSPECENLSTKRKKSVSLAEEVKVFNGIENEFFAENEAGFCNELMDYHSDKIMDRERSETGSEDKMYDLTLQKTSTAPAGSKCSIPNYLNTVKSTEKDASFSQDQMIEIEETKSKLSPKYEPRISSKDLIKEIDNSAENLTILSCPQSISNTDEEWQETQTSYFSARNRVMDVQNWRIASAPEKNRSTVSLVETKIHPSSSKLNKSVVFVNENTQHEYRVDETIEIYKDSNVVEADDVTIDESRKNSYIIDHLDTDEVYGKTRLSSADETASENMSEENEKIKQIRKLMNEFLSGLIKKEIAEENENYNRDNIYNDTEKNDTPIDDDAVMEKSHGEFFKINDQLLADSRPSEVSRNSEITVRDVTQTSITSDITETNEGTNNSMPSRKDGQLEELKLSNEELSMESTFETKTRNLQNDPLSTETLTKVSLKGNKLSKQSLGPDGRVDHQSTNDLSSKQTSSTVSREGSESSRKSSRAYSSDVISPEPNNLTEETFPVFVKDKDVLKHTDYLHVKEPESTRTLKAEESSTNLEYDEQEDGGRPSLDNSPGAFALINVSRRSSNATEPPEESRKDITSAEGNTVNGEVDSSKKCAPIESPETLKDETTTQNYSPVVYNKSESVVVAYLATPSVQDQSVEQTLIEEKVESIPTLIENETDPEELSDSVIPDKEKDLNLSLNLTSIFKSLNKSQSQNRSVASIEDLEDTNTVKKSSEIEVDEEQSAQCMEETVEVQLIQSTKSLQDNRNRTKNRRKTGHKLFDEPFGTEDLVHQSCQATTHNDFTEMKNTEKSEDVAVANVEANYSEESVVESSAQNSLADEEEVDEKTPKISDKITKSEKQIKSEENAKKFAFSLSKIFSNSSSKRHGAKKSRTTVDSKTSPEDHFDVTKIPLSSSDDFETHGNSCVIRKQKSDVTEDNREELDAIKSLDSVQHSFTVDRESIAKSSSKYSTKASKNQLLGSEKSASTIVPYAPMVESAKYTSAEDRDDRSIADDHPVEKPHKKSSGKSFAGIRKLFSGASTRNKEDQAATEDHAVDQVGHNKANQNSIISAKISSVASVNVVVNKVEVSHIVFKPTEIVGCTVIDEILVQPESQTDVNNVTNMEQKASQRSNDTKKGSLLSMAKNYMRRRSEIEKEETEAVKRRCESSEDSITLSTGNRKKISKEQDTSKTQSVFYRGVRRLFKKRSSVVDSVASNNNSVRDSADDLRQSPDKQNPARPPKHYSNDFMTKTKTCGSRNSKAKEKSDVEQLVYSTTEPPWKDLEANKAQSTVRLLRSMAKDQSVDELPKARSKSHNRSTISDDDYDIETSSNVKIREKYTEIKFMGQDKPGNKTGVNPDENIAQKQRWSEITSNHDFRPIPSFASRRSTIVMMATPLEPRKGVHLEESSSSNHSRDESSSSPTAFYYLLGPSLDEALIDVRVVFQNLIDKIIGRDR